MGDTAGALTTSLWLLAFYCMLAHLGPALPASVSPRLFLTTRTCSAQQSRCVGELLAPA